MLIDCGLSPTAVTTRSDCANNSCVPLALRPKIRKPVESPTDMAKREGSTIRSVISWLSTVICDMPGTSASGSRAVISLKPGATAQACVP